MKKASIDIGSNSVLLSICEVSAGRINEIASSSHVTSLGRDLDKTKRLNVEAKTNTLAALRDYRAQIEAQGIPKSAVVVTGTEVLRAALDAPGFIVEIENVIGAELHLLTGEGEAYYTAMGVAFSPKIKDSNVFIMDMGGASTELIHFNKDDLKIIKTVSLPVGAARSTQWLEDQNFELKMNAIFEHYDLNQYQAESLVCVAGSMTTLAAMVAGLREFSAQKLEGLTISIDKFNQFCQELEQLEATQLMTHYPVAASRAKTIQAGARAARTLFEKLKVKQLVISTFGLRHGTIAAEVIDGRLKTSK